MGYKFNPFTGNFDLVGSSDSPQNENTFLNVLQVSGDLSIQGDQSLRIINLNTAANNLAVQSITVNSNGELIVGSSATLEVA